MLFPVRPLLFVPVLAFLCFAPLLILAQTSIDDVHITPRDHPLSPGALEAVTASPGGLLRAKVDLVLVPVSITDDNAQPVLGLERENFQLYENKKPQQIRDFSSEDAPISVGIIVDSSGSMQNKLDWAREAVRQFCETANPADEFFLVTFSDQPQIATDFTTNTDEIENAMLTLRSTGRTALLDAIQMGVRKLKDARYARKALLILSDGGDNHSRFTEHQVKSLIKESDVAVYSVGIFDHYVSTEEELLGPELLREVSDMTGGTAFTLSRLNQMPVLTRVIGIQLRHQYMLAYRPQSTPSDRKWRKISVKLRVPKSLHVGFLHIGARQGYYGRGE